MKIRSGAVLPVRAPVCCGRSIFSVSLKCPCRALCLSLSLFYLYEWFFSRNKCLSANFFFFSPLKRRWTACQCVQTMDEKQTEFVSEVFSFMRSQSLMWKCLSNHHRHTSFCALNEDWNSLLSKRAIQKGETEQFHWSLRRRVFYKDTPIPISEVEKQAEIFCRATYQRAMVNPAA